VSTCSASADHEHRCQEEQPRANRPQYTLSMKRGSATRGQSVTRRKSDQRRTLSDPATIVAVTPFRRSIEVAGPRQGSRVSARLPALRRRRTAPEARRRARHIHIPYRRFIRDHGISRVGTAFVSSADACGAAPGSMPRRSFAFQARSVRVHHSSVVSPDERLEYSDPTQSADSPRQRVHGRRACELQVVPVARADEFGGSVRRYRGELDAYRDRSAELSDVRVQEVPGADPGGDGGRKRHGEQLGSHGAGWQRVGLFPGHRPGRYIAQILGRVPPVSGYEQLGGHRRRARDSRLDRERNRRRRLSWFGHSCWGGADSATGHADSRRRHVGPRNRVRVSQHM
jgi:hypothetical protein